MVAARSNRNVQAAAYTAGVLDASVVTISCSVSSALSVSVISTEAKTLSRLKRWWGGQVAVRSSFFGRTKYTLTLTGAPALRMLEASWLYMGPQRLEALAATKCERAKVKSLA